jgi:hypothetical protein
MRLSNAFSKEFESNVHLVALYTVWYNWIRIRKTLRTKPAIATNFTTHLMRLDDIVALIDVLAPQGRVDG